MACARESLDTLLLIVAWPMDPTLRSIRETSCSSRVGRNLNETNTYHPSLVLLREMYHVAATLAADADVKDVLAAFTTDPVSAAMAVKDGVDRARTWMCAVIKKLPKMLWANQKQVKNGTDCRTSGRETRPGSYAKSCSQKIKRKSSMSHMNQLLHMLLTTHVSMSWIAGHLSILFQRKT